MGWLSRLPLRIRLTLAFTAVMAVVLAGTGLFLYLRLGNELDNTIEHGLRSRAGDVAALVTQPGSGLAQAGVSPLTEQGENLAQVIDASGAVVDSTPGLRPRPLVSSAVIERVLGGSNVFVDIGPIKGADDASRLLATRASAPGGQLVVVVGAPMDDRNDALRNLATLLLLGGPVALLLAALAGYGVAAAALRPVERMRAQAAAIQAASPGERLDVPAADDEIRRLAATLNAMLGRLEAGIERERSFVADASHELRTPLAILKAEIELALRGERSTNELTAALRSAGEETDRLVQLAEDLLVIARAQQDGLEIRPQDTDLAALLSAVAGRFAGRAQQAGATVNVATGGSVSARADGPRLEQALGNLVDNALRHGGRRIELAAEATDDAVRLHVRDDGPGFASGFTEQAFERFTRGDAARGRGGAGLGLAIVQAIAAAHGGSAGAANRDGAGADVWIEIPLPGERS